MNAFYVCLQTWKDYLKVKRKTNLTNGEKGSLKDKNVTDGVLESIMLMLFPSSIILTSLTSCKIKGRNLPHASHLHTLVINILLIRVSRGSL